VACIRPTSIPRPASSIAAKRELYDLAADPSESKDLSSAQPGILAKLTALAAAAHHPAREGTFADTTFRERERRAKYGKHDDDTYIATPGGISKKGAKKKP